MHRDEDVVRFARTGETSPLGKLGQNLGSFRLHERVEEVARRRAAELHMPLMEFVRQFVEVGLMGREAIEHEQKVRLDALERCKRNDTEPKP